MTKVLDFLATAGLGILAPVLAILEVLQLFLSIVHTLLGVAG